MVKKEESVFDRLARLLKEGARTFRRVWRRMSFAFVLPALCPARISVPSMLRVATMTRNPSWAKPVNCVSHALTASPDEPEPLADQSSVPGCCAQAGSVKQKEIADAIQWVLLALRVYRVGYPRLGVDRLCGNPSDESRHCRCKRHGARS